MNWGNNVKALIGLIVFVLAITWLASYSVSWAVIVATVALLYAIHETFY